jgi:hypothetical protein
MDGRGVALKQFSVIKPFTPGGEAAPPFGPSVPHSSLT